MKSAMRETYAFNFGEKRVTYQRLWFQIPLKPAFFRLPCYVTFIPTRNSTS